MHWILQTNLLNEKTTDDLITQLERQNTLYSLVEMVPFSGEITPDIDVDGEIFVCGSTSLGKVSRKKGWKPGYIDENIDMAILLEHYGEEMLNYGAIICKFKDVEHIWDRFFIRPCSDNKEFAGQVMTWDEFIIWQQQVLALEGSYSSLTGDDMVVINKPAEIYTEYRFYVVNGKVITGSQYKLGDSVIYSNVVDYRVEWYASDMIHRWSPNQAFVIDIADTPNGLFIIEINSINSSGFYHCDMGKFVNAINNMRYRE